MLVASLCLGSPLCLWASRELCGFVKPFTLGVLAALVSLTGSGCVTGSLGFPARCTTPSMLIILWPSVRLKPKPNRPCVVLLVSLVVLIARSTKSTTVVQLQRFWGGSSMARLGL